MKSIIFKINQKDTTSKARTGEIRTPHGVVRTPNFCAVGTQGTVKALDGQDLQNIGLDIVLANTYHLHIRPGEDVIDAHGGVAAMMDWNGPTMTDSGGFQVFSLGVALEQGVGKLLRENDDTVAKPRLNKITEDGVHFQSHIDGTPLFLSPETSIAIQEKIGADLIVAFDDLESPKYDYKETKRSLDLTEKWLIRSKKAHKRGDQLLYGVTHGGSFEDLRIESAKTNDKIFDAIALGGAHSSKENMYDVVRWTVDNVDENKPKHMLGVGEIDDIFHIVELGIDTFDCVIPTRVARMGWYFVYPPEGNPKNRFRKDISKSLNSSVMEPLSKDCQCMVCQKYTKAYIHHLFKARELLGYRLLTYHNLAFYADLMSKIRESIENGNFESLKKMWLE
ncbi:MAG TPA: tRNA guanosine(34) transglycosylase Tgt [Candidatus Levybacteria bacterium]|nr:tRNA guanosine(34) transglycosylase Tgt [Candidatus Levybacteria bacterium]